MTDEVGRTRAGRVSKAHGSARRELVNVDKIPSRAKGKNVVVAGSAQAQEEEPQDENEEQMEVETEPGLEEQQQEDEDDLSDFFDFGDEEEEQEQEQQVEAQAEPQPQPPQKKERKKNKRTTQGRNPPRAGEGKVSSYPGGPTDLSLLPGFGKHVAASLWRGECKTRYLRCMNNGKKINEFTLPKSNLDWFWNVVKASGLQPLLKTNYNNLDWGLLTAFTERWQPETDLNLVNTWNWGASGLAYLYNYLEKATKPRCGNHGGYDCMFQAWIYEHFTRFGGGGASEKYRHWDPICLLYHTTTLFSIPPAIA
ncbi:hypothetical protein TSUD_320890 [Trifolium subterraneum]|uniref:Aminotransferase-like plant mobile domain-containing protein n=1 Tax=Trifolium subterraneum TaxID=3900 RepID=A0A2Z6N2P1_TRISU|nr:hypothetical protein TSUD_320890 [Trifolium subterraneum]